MNTIEVNSLETARKLNEAKNLLVDISDAFEWLDCCDVPTNGYADRVKGLFGVFEYATGAAFWTLDEYTDKYMEKYGISYPLTDNVNNKQAMEEEQIND